MNRWLQCLLTKVRFDMARQITRYTNHHGFILQSDTGEYVKYDEVAPYIKEGVQTQTTNSARNETMLRCLECFDFISGDCTGNQGLVGCNERRTASSVA